MEPNHLISLPGARRAILESRASAWCSAESQIAARYCYGSILHDLLYRRGGALRLHDGFECLRAITPRMLKVWTTLHSQNNIPRVARFVVKERLRADHGMEWLLLGSAVVARSFLQLLYAADAVFQRPAAPRTHTMTPRHLVVRARAGVVAVPPVCASGVQSLTIQPAASTVTVPIAVIAGPPPDTGYKDPIVEVIVEAMVMGEGVVVVVMPIPMPAVCVPRTATVSGEGPTTNPRNL